MALNKDGIEAGAVVDYETMVKTNQERKSKQAEVKKPVKKAVKKPVPESESE